MPSQNQQTGSPAAAWARYGNHHFARRTSVEDVRTVGWGLGNPGPGTAALGDLDGRRVLDLGSGTGRHAAHLARDHGAQVTGLDISLGQHRRAVELFGHLPGLAFVCEHPAVHLARAEPYDVVMSVNGALCYSDPRILLPAIAGALRPSGLLAASVMLVNNQGVGPSDTVASRREVLQLQGGAPVEVDRWVLETRLWLRLLDLAGFAEVDTQVLPSLRDGDPTCSLLLRARPRNSPYAAGGAT